MVDQKRERLERLVQKAEQFGIAAQELVQCFAECGSESGALKALVDSFQLDIQACMETVKGWDEDVKLHN